MSTILKRLAGASWLCAFSVALADPVSVPQPVQAALPAVVHLVSRDSTGPVQPAPATFIGAGVVIDSDRRIVTLAHLLARKPILVRLVDGRELEAEIIFSDAKSDIAVLSVNAKGIPAAPIGDPAALAIGARVFAVGAAPDGSTAITEGRVNQKQLQPYPAASFIQTTASITPGMGGGPLFDEDGRLLGLNVLLISRSSMKPISFVVPITYALAVTDGVRKK